MSERSNPIDPINSQTAHERRVSKEGLLRAVQNMRPKDARPVFVAISGFGGTGKSTLAAFLSASLKRASVVPIDDFIIGERTQRSTDWATFDRERLTHNVLEPARIGQTIRYQQYNSGEWVQGRGGSWREIEIGQLVIIEGCGILHPSLMPHYDISAWIDCPHDVALESAKRRDRQSGELFENDDTDKLWNEVWGPNDLDFFTTFKPDMLATILVERQV